MKKRILLFVIMICILVMPMNCFASEMTYNTNVVSENMVLLGSGYTDEGVYYEVYGEPYTGNLDARVALTVQRTVVYVGEVMPPSTIDWTEKISGLEMSGTLYLRSYIYNASTNRTTANYTGTLVG